MVVSVPRYRLWGLGALAVTLTLLGMSGRGQGQPPKAGDTSGYLGAKNCEGCHGDNGPRIYSKASQEFLMMTEHKTWKEHDLHSRGFEALSSPLGAQMGRILKEDVTKKPQCLTCHAVDLAQKSPLTQKSFHTESGVGCEACHGIAKDWFARHIAPTLRTATPKEKEDLGMWDMRNPNRRAERCTSCHVGNEADGRFVTHEMYAAGHPPLLPLEVMAFSRDQKMHYKPPGELSYIRDLANSDPAKSWDLYHFRGEQESPQTRQVAVGAIMSLRSAAKLLADRAGAIDPSKEALDLAHFDCYACHHDLQSPSWRQARGYVGVPGRPQIRPGVALPAKIVAEHAAGALNADSSSPLRMFGDNFKVLTDAFDARPFGDPAKVAEAAKSLVAWCDDTLKQLDNVRYNREQTAKLLKAFADAGQAPPEGKTNPWLDADAAQQLVWSVESLRGELEGPDGPIAQTLDTLKSKLPREVRDTSKMDFLATTLGSRLKREYDFTPDEFHAAFAKLAGMVK